MQINEMITVHWGKLHDEHESWHQSGCVYAYLPPRRVEPFYIGKAVGTTVRQRHRARDKAKVFDMYQATTGTRDHHVMVGHLEFESGRRYSKEKVRDVERLLIVCVEPWCNNKGIYTTQGRTGLLVHCAGEWRMSATSFFDDGYDIRDVSREWARQTRGAR